MDPDQAYILSGLIWVQTVLKGYLQMTKAGKELWVIEKGTLRVRTFSEFLFLCVTFLIFGVVRIINVCFYGGISLLLYAFTFTKGFQLKYQTQIIRFIHCMLNS